MKVSVVGGTGYVGITLACLADYGHDVVLIGRAQDKIQLINSGKSPIYEPGLDEIIKRNIDDSRLKATDSFESIKDSDVVFICVGTPSKEDGSNDLSQVKEASMQISEEIKNTEKHVVVVLKSTSIPGTTKDLVIPTIEKYSGKKVGKDFGVCMNPEFLREGTAVYDFLNPDKIVIGAYDEKSSSVLLKLYENFDKSASRLVTDVTTAEMIKYVQNAALAARVSFINEIANICEKFNVDVNEIAHAIGLDTRIGPKFLNAGIGFGGSCFPKDVKAFIAAAKSIGIDPIFLNAIIEVNERQPHRMIELSKEVLGDFKNKKIAVLGLAFKPDTDDMREARSIPIVNALIENGAIVKAYDPQAMENAKAIFGNSIEYCSNKEECIKDSDLCMIITEWDEFKNLDLKSVKCPIVDGRRAIDPNKTKEFGIVYKGIGWKND